MTVVSSFCCCFNLRTGAIFSGFYVLVLSCVFLTKHAVWLQLLLVGQVPDALEPFIDTLLRDRNDSWNPTALNLTAELHRRNVVSHTLHILWTCGGIATSVVLLLAIFKKVPLLFLPWLSWSSVNGIITLVNAVVDVLIWSYFHLYSSVNAFTVYGYVSLPFMAYLLFVTASYYQTLESAYDGNQLRCSSLCRCEKLRRRRAQSDSDGRQASAGFRWWWSGRNDASQSAGTRSGARWNESEQRRLMSEGGDRGEEIVHAATDSKRECARACARSPLTRFKRRSYRTKNNFTLPKIKVSEASTDDDW